MMKRQSNSLFILLTAFFSLSQVLSQQLLILSNTDWWFDGIDARSRSHARPRSANLKQKMAVVVASLLVDSDQTHECMTSRTTMWNGAQSRIHCKTQRYSSTTSLSRCLSTTKLYTETHFTRHFNELQRNFKCSRCNDGVRMWIDDGFCCIYINLSKRSSLEIHNFCSCVRLLHL